jgi:hypothetical protein
MPAAAAADNSHLVDPKLCGASWQRDYVNFWSSNGMYQNSVRLPVHQRRYLFFVAVRAGGADNFVGFVSWFLFALITRRAFFYVPLRNENNHAFDIEWVYQPRSFNWSSFSDLNVAEDHMHCLFPSYRYDKHEKLVGNGPCRTVGKLFPNDSEDSTFHIIDNINRSLQLFKNGNISEASDGSNVVVVASNRGYTYSTFDNPLYAPLLKSWGLRPETIFGCLYNFLLKMDDDVRLLPFRLGFLTIMDQGVRKQP